MHTIFKDVKGVCYFQDDILIYANSQSEHDQILRIVLSKFRYHGLLVNKDKCRFGQTSVHYLSHTITPDGITPKEDLVRQLLMLLHLKANTNYVHFLDFASTFQSS